MQSKTKSIASTFQPPTSGGAMVRAGASAPAVPGSLKPERTLSDLGSLWFAARRFAKRDEIEEVFFFGSNGLGMRLPNGDAARLALFRRLPPPEACWKLEALLNAEIATRVTPDDIRQAIIAVVAAFPTGARVAAEYLDGMADFLVEEAQVEGWPRIAIHGGLLRIMRASTFLPAVAEVVGAIRDERRFIFGAATIAGRAAELFLDLEAKLLDSGLIRVEFGAGDF